MADQIVSWGGIESKGTAGMGITGSLGILNTNTSSSVLLDITGSTNNSFTFRSNPILSAGQQNGLRVNVSTAGYDPNGANIAYNFQVGGTSYFTIANYGLAKFNQSIETKSMLIQSNPTSTTSLIVYAQGAASNAIETVGSEGTVHLGSNTVNTKVNEILRITGKGTTSSTTAFRVQNANASASFSVRDDGLVDIPGGGKLNFNNGSTECYITTANGGTGLGSRSLTLPGTGGPAHWLFYNDSAYGIRLQDSTGDWLTISPGSTSTTSIFTINKSAASGFGGGTFVYYQTNNSNRIYTFGNPSSERGDETGVHTKIVAGAGGTVSTQYGRGGNVYLEGGAPAFTSSLPGDILISTGVTGSKVGIGTSTPSASLHISGSSNNALFEIDSPAVNNIIYVSGSGNVGIGTGTPTSRLTVENGNVSFGSTSLGSTLFINGGFGNASDDAYMLSLSARNAANYAVGTKQWIQFGIGSSPSTTSGIAGINLGNNNYESGLIFATSTGGSGLVERMRIWNDGNISIGNTSSSARVFIKGSGTTSSTTAFLVQNANASNMLSLTDNGALTVNTFQTSSTAFTINRTNSSMGGSFNLATLGTLISINDTVGNSNGTKTSVYINSSGASNNNAAEIYGGVGIGYAPYGNNFYVGYNTAIYNTTRIQAVTGFPLTSRDATQNYNISTGGGISFWGDASGQGNPTSAYAGIRGLKANNTYVNGLGNLAFYVQTGSSHVITETTFKEVGRFTELGYFGIGTSTPSSSLHISGASAVLTLTPQDPLPSGVPTGSFAVSSSAPPKPYFYDGTTWNALY